MADIEVQGDPESTARPFDPYEADCFSRFINKSNEQVTSLILGLRDSIESQGEYDQGDAVALDFDDARDLAVVAEMLWRRYVTIETDDEPNDGAAAVAVIGENVRLRAALREIADAGLPPGAVRSIAERALRARPTDGV